MLLSVKAIVGMAIAISLSFVFNKWSSYRRFRSAARQHGCERPSQYLHRDPIWGLDLTRKRMEAAKRGRQLAFSVELFSQYGKTYEENFLGTQLINTMERRNIQHVAALGEQDYVKVANPVFDEILGNGIFSQNGSAWKRSRELVKPTFSRVEVGDVTALEKHVDRFMSAIPPRGETVDLQGRLHNLFLDSATEFLFGESMDAQLPDTPQRSADFLDAFNAILAGVAKRNLAGRFASLIFVFDSSWKKACRRLPAAIDVYVQRALAQTEPGANKFSNDENPQRYFLLNEMAKQIRDPVDLRFQIINVFLPARNTTSILVGNALFHLARNPGVWTELRTESLAIGDKPLTFELLKSLQLFKYVIQETIRLQGPGNRIRRTANRDTTLPVGGGPNGTSPIFVEKGSQVSLSVWGLHHDPSIWGPDVNIFKPERWTQKRQPWEFVPFLGGPRICPAQQQVLTQVTYLLVRMTREFEGIENRDPVLEYVEQTGVTTESRSGIRVAFV